jgi:hypothetical protein
MSAKNDVLIFGGLAIAAVLALAFLAKAGKEGGQAAVDWIGQGIDKIGRGLSDAASATGAAVNPTADTNLIYRATSNVGSILVDPGYEGATIGSMFADTFKPSSERAVDEMLRSVPVAKTHPQIFTPEGVLTDSKYRDMVR